MFKSTITNLSLGGALSVLCAIGGDPAWAQQQVNRNPTEKGFISGQLIRDGYFQDLDLDNWLFNDPFDVPGAGNGIGNETGRLEDDLGPPFVDQDNPETDGNTADGASPGLSADEELRAGLIAKIKFNLVQGQRNLDHLDRINEGVRNGTLDLSSLKQRFGLMQDIANDPSLANASIADLGSLEGFANQFRRDTDSLVGVLDPADIYIYPNANISSQGTMPRRAHIRPQIHTSFTYSHQSTSGAAARDGHVAQVRVGVQVPVSQTVALGATLSLSDGDNDSTALASTLDSRKVGITTSAKIALSPDTQLAFSAAYIHGEHDVSITGFTGSFTTKTLAIATGIKRRFKGPGGWNITPRIGTSYASIKRGSYVNSAPVVVPGATEHYGLVQGAVRFDKQFVQGALVYAPWFDLGADWLYDKPADTVLLDGTVLASDASGISLGGGVDFVVGPRATGFVSARLRQSGKSDSWTIGVGFEHGF